MANDIILSWDIREAPPVKKSIDWFWAVGIIIISLAVIAIAFGNPLFGVFLILVLFTLIVLSYKRPQMVHYAITKDGIFESDKFFPFANLKSFHVDEETYMVPTLLIEIKRWFMPIVAIPLPNEITPQDVRALLRPNLLEHPLKEPVFHHLFEILGL